MSSMACQTNQRTVAIIIWDIEIILTDRDNYFVRDVCQAAVRLLQPIPPNILMVSLAVIVCEVFGTFKDCLWFRFDKKEDDIQDDFSRFCQVWMNFQHNYQMMSEWIYIEIQQETFPAALPRQSWDDVLSVLRHQRDQSSHMLTTTVALDISRMWLRISIKFPDWNVQSW